MWWSLHDQSLDDGKIPTKFENNLLTHWGRVPHVCVGRLTITGSDNGLSPGRRQDIIRTNAVILLIGPLGTNFSENSIEILAFSFTKMRLKVSSAKWRPFCLGLNVLKTERLGIYSALLGSCSECWWHNRKQFAKITISIKSKNSQVWGRHSVLPVLKMSKRFKNVKNRKVIKCLFYAILNFDEMKLSRSIFLRS